MKELIVNLNLLKENQVWSYLKPDYKEAEMQQKREKLLRHLIKDESNKIDIWLTL